MQIGRIVIAGETYSDNLGDGVIAETMAIIFRQAFPDAEIRLLDITCRQAQLPVARSTTGPTLGARLRAVFGNRVMNLALWTAVRRRRCLALWKRQLDGASLLIIGGGQLLMDNDWDFPLRLASLARLARSNNLAVHISACGVGTNRPWSPFGKRLLGQVLRSAETITVRDPASQAKLQARFPSLSSLVTFDPAVWVSELYPAAFVPAESRLVGLGVIDAAKVAEYNPQTRSWTRQTARDFWLELIERLAQGEIPFELFTNGSVADHRFAEELAALASAKLGRPCPMARRPETPEQLARTISRYGALVASRLHASIIATAYGIPAVGLVWDDKVRVYYEQIGSEEHCLSLDQWQADAVLSALQAARATPPDPACLQRWQQAAARSAGVVAESRGLPK